MQYVVCGVQCNCTVCRVQCEVFTVQVESSEACVYVGQKEAAVVAPGDRIRMLGSEDATTCHIVVLRWEPPWAGAGN